MNSTCHCTSTILQLCCIVTEYSTPTSSFLDGTILRIGTATIKIDTCVPRGVHWTLIQIFFNFTVIGYHIELCHKYFLKLTMDHLTEAASPTKLCLEFYCSDTVDTKMKEIGHICITSRDFSNSHFSPAFYCSSVFLASTN